MVVQLARTGRKSRPNFMYRPTSPGGRHVCPVISITRWGCNLGADAESGAVRNRKPSDSSEEMHRKSDLFVFHRKTHSSPSVLIIDICLDSRI